MADNPNIVGGAPVDSGTYYTTESMKLKRQLAQAMLQQGLDSSPIRSGWQGAARMAQAALGGYDLYKLDQQDQNDFANARDLNARATGAAGGAPPPSLSRQPDAPQPPAPPLFDPQTGAVSTPPTSTGAAPAPAPASEDARRAAPAKPGGEDFIDWLKRREGFSPTPSYDYGNNSIGYGTKAKPGQRSITREQADTDLRQEEAYNRGLVTDWAYKNGVKLSPKAEDALTDLTFNQGPSWQNQGLGAAIRSGNLQAAKASFEKYVNAGGKPLPDLIDRRLKMSQNILDTTPADASSPSARVADASGATVPQAMPGTAIDLSTPQDATATQPSPAGGPPAAVSPPGTLPTSTPAPGQPATTPASSPGLPTTPVVAKASLNDQTWAELNKSSPGLGDQVKEILRTGNPNSRTYQQAVAIFNGTQSRIAAAAPPIEPEKQAALAKTQAEARKLGMEAEDAASGRPSRLKTSEEDAKEYGSMHKGLAGAGLIAAQQRPNIQALKEITDDPRFVSGIAPDMQLRVQKMAAAMGIDSTGAAPTELFKAVMARVLTDQLSGMRSLSSEAGETATRVFKSFVDQEEKALANTGDTLAGVRAKIAILDRGGQQAMKWADMADDYKAEHGSLDAGFAKRIRAEMAKPENGLLAPGETRTLGATGLGSGEAEKAPAATASGPSKSDIEAEMRRRGLIK